MTYVDYKSYEKGGIGSELMNFFLRENGIPLNDGKFGPRTLHDFLDHCPERHENQHPYIGFTVRIFCQRLINEALLYSVGFDATQESPYNEQFFSYFFEEESAEYGIYDFIALSFPEIAKHFKPSVIKLIVTRSSESPVITGTSFLLPNNLLVTAAHCLPKGANICIEDWNPQNHPIKGIWMFPRESSNPFVPIRGLIDIAVIEFESDPFPESPKFKLWAAEILDQGLIVGFPNITGFDSIQIAVLGQIVNEDKSHIRAQPMVLVDAKIKGGNSGGPIINREGNVIGVITNAESGGEIELDNLGYAIATPAQTLLDLVNAIHPSEERFIPDLYKINFQQNSDNSILILN